MFNKKLEKQFDEYTIKYYISDSSIYSSMDEIVNSGIEFETAEVYDKGDVGMKYFGGTYSFDVFLQMYDKIKEDIDTLSLKLPEKIGSIDISTDDKYIRLIKKDI